MSEKKYSIDDIINEIKENKISPEELEEYSKDFGKFDTTALLDDILGRSSDDVLEGIDLKDNGLTPEENAEAEKLLAEILAADQKEKEADMTFSAPKPKKRKTPRPLKPLTPVDERSSSPLKNNPAMDYAVHMDDVTRLLSKEDLEREAKRFREKCSLSSRPFDPNPSHTPLKADIPPWKARQKTAENQKTEKAPDVSEPKQVQTPKNSVKTFSAEGKSEEDTKKGLSIRPKQHSAEESTPESSGQDSAVEQSKESVKPPVRSDKKSERAVRPEVTTQIYRPVDPQKEPDTIEIARLGDLERPENTVSLLPQPEEPVQEELPGQLNLLTGSEEPSGISEIHSTTTEIRVGPMSVEDISAEQKKEEKVLRKDSVLDDAARLKYIALRKNREDLVKGFALEPGAVNTGSIPVSEANETLQQEIENADISIDTSGSKRTPLVDFSESVLLEKEDVPLFSAGEAKKARHIDSQKVNEWKEKVGEHIRAEEEELPDEYISYDQTEEVRDMLSEMRQGILFRMVGSLFVFLLSMGLLWINRPEDGAVIALLDAGKNPMVYCLVNLALMVLLFAFSFDVIKSGVISIFKKSPGRTAMYAVAQIFLLIFSAVLLTYPEVVNEKNIHVYIPLLAVCMVMLYVGRLLGVRRTMKNFDRISKSGDKYATDIVDSQELAEDLTKGALNDYPFLACSRKTSFLSDFLEESFSEDITDKHAKYVLGAVCSIALIVAVAALFRGSDLYGALTALTGVLVVGAGASALFVVNAPLMRAANELSRVGGTVLGYNAADTYRDVNSVLVSANDLFGKDDVTLYGIKTFSNMAIDRAILDATSVLCETKSILGRIFMKIISDRTDYLDPVDTVIYEDGMGISAWVKDRRVLIGSRELMINHNIDVPSRDYEERYIAQDRNLIYLSAAGELSAVFVVGLSGNDEIRNMLVDLYNDDIAVIVKSVDPILTKAQLAKVFDMPEDAFRVIPSRLHKECEQLAESDGPVNGAVSNNGTFVSYLYSLLVAKRMNKAISIAQLMNFVSIGVGVLFFIAFTAVESISQLSNLILCIYEVAFVVLTLAGQKLKKLIP